MHPIAIIDGVRGDSTGAGAAEARPPCHRRRIPKNLLQHMLDQHVRCRKVKTSMSLVAHMQPRQTRLGLEVGRAALTEVHLHNHDRPRAGPAVNLAVAYAVMIGRTQDHVMISGFDKYIRQDERVHDLDARPDWGACRAARQWNKPSPRLVGRKDRWLPEAQADAVCGYTRSQGPPRGPRVADSWLGTRWNGNVPCDLRSRWKHLSGRKFVEIRAQGFRGAGTRIRPSLIRV